MLQAAVRGTSTRRGLVTYRSLLPQITNYLDRLVDSVPNEPAHYLNKDALLSGVTPHPSTFYLERCGGRTRDLLFPKMLRFAIRDAPLVLAFHNPLYSSSTAQGSIHDEDSYLHTILSFYSDAEDLNKLRGQWLKYVEQPLFSKMMEFADRFFPDEEHGYTRGFAKVFKFVSSSSLEVVKNKKPITDKVIQILESQSNIEGEVGVQLIAPAILRIGCYDLKYHSGGDKASWKLFTDVCFIYREKINPVPGRSYPVDLKDIEFETEYDLLRQMMQFQDKDEPNAAWRVLTTTWRFETDHKDSNWVLTDILEVSDRLSPPTRTERGK